MALVLTEEQMMLKESAAGLLAQKAGVAQLRALRDAGDARGICARGLAGYRHHGLARYCHS